jgi:hypothetical protein
MKRIFLFSISLLLAVFGLQAQDYSQVYLLGGAIANGWDNQHPQTMKRVELTATDAIYEWTGNLLSGDFKFIDAIGSWGSYNALTANEQVISGHTHGLTFGAADHKFVIDAGRYTITVNLIKRTMIVVPASTVFPDLWITGSAVPEPTKLASKQPGTFIYGGPLQAGDIKLMTTATEGNNTQYFISMVSFESIGGVSEFRQTSDAGLPGWTVCDGGVYKIKVNLDAKTLTVSPYTSPGQLYIVGGCTAVGWAADRAIALQQDANDPSLFVFDGTLRPATSGETPNQFKLLGQKNWSPISYHPHIAGSPLLEADYVYENLPGDYKWAMNPAKPGRYIITVNLLKETIRTEYKDGTAIQTTDDDTDYQCLAKNGSIEIILSGNKIIGDVVLFDISGNILAIKQNQTGHCVVGNHLPAGVYLIKITADTQTIVKKIIVK